MSTIAEELLILQQAKTNLSVAIAEKGVDVPSKFADYGTAVSSIQPGVDPEPYIRMIVGFMQSQNLPSSSDGPTPEEKRLVTIPEEITERVTIIGGNTFQSKRYLTHLSFPNAKKIWAMCFADCRALSSLELPALEYIAGGPFGNTSSGTHIPISSLNIPNIKSIVAKAFGASESNQFTDIMDLYIDNKTKAEITAMANYSTWNLAPSCLIHGSDKTFYYRSQEDYDPSRDPNKTYLFKNDGTVIENDIVGEIGQTYMGNTTLSAVEVGRHVTSIGGQAFRNCTYINNVTIPDTVTDIKYNAFDGCQRLVSIEIPESVSALGSMAFKGCAQLSSINVPRAVRNIPDNAFNGCQHLSSIVLPNVLTGLGYQAFNTCYQLRSVEMPTSLSSIGNNVFCECSRLSSINLPNDLVKIGQSAFSKCSRLTAITIPESVTTIGPGAFYKCVRLSNMVFDGKTVADVKGITNYRWSTDISTIIHCTDADITS